MLIFGVDRWFIEYQRTSSNLRRQFSVAGEDMSTIALRTAIARRIERLGENTTTLALFASTLFLSAVLLFSVQPIFAKIVLPTLGGSPSVWAVSMCFFQAVLLAGYCYAYALNRYMPLQYAPLAHVVMLAVAFLALPFGLPEGVAPPAGDAYFWLIGVLTVGVGLPFFAVSANAPLLQAWFARTKHPHAKDPYFLYGASNLGSLLALLSYPIIIEPLLGLKSQALTWTGGFLLLALSVALCGLLLWAKSSLTNDHDDVTATAVTSDASQEASAAPSWLARISWIGLAFVPSGLLVAYTSYLATDIASAPFIWVIPLATFLATFVFIFRDTPIIPRHWLLRSQPLIIAFLLLDIAAPGILPGWFATLLGFFAFFVTTMVAHTVLYEKRPGSENLTEFYMWMSLGGVLGGVFAAIITPQIFNTIFEFPLLLLAGMLCRPRVLEQLRSKLTMASKEYWRQPAMFFGLLVVTAMLFWVELLSSNQSAIIFTILVTACAYLLLSSREDAPHEFAYVAILVSGIFLLPTHLSLGHSERSFYGVHKVLTTPDGAMRVLLHGTTIHGALRIKTDDGKPIAFPRPATYYHDEGLMARGLVAVRKNLEALGRTPMIGVVGVGAGSLVCYAKANEKWRLYEIDPLVVKLATDPKHFTFFSKCHPKPDFVLGDARLTLAKEPKAKFDYLVIDAFSSDAVPVHLITREAFAMYLDKVANDGVVALHISNRHMDLNSVASATARSIPGVHTALGINIQDGSKGLDRTSSKVMFLSRSKSSLKGLLLQDDVEVAPKTSTAPWTDDYSNIIAAIWRKWRQEK